MTGAGQIPVFDRHESNLDPVAIGQALDEIGCVVLRNLLPAASIDAVIERVARLMENPALCGAQGYIKVDHPKKLLAPTLVGGPIYDLVLNEEVIDLVEGHMASECILAEMSVKHDRGVGYGYFPLHADFAAGWRKSAESPPVLDAEGMKQPIGIGAAVYLHDTSEGAFSYCVGTHRLMAPHGQVLARYPAEERRRIEAAKVRVDGLKGDMVLFDDRGFHGPDQPSRADRLIVLIDYYRVATFGRTQVTPFPVWTNDLGRLSEKQMRVLGAGADYMVAPHEHKWNKFRRNRLHGLIRRLVENAYLWEHIKHQAKARLGRS